MTPALLILDLDETLVYATQRVLDREPDFYCDPYALYRRPYLTHFLEAVRHTYRLAVWTSSTRSYMECVLANILPEELALEFAWARERCTRVFDAEYQSVTWEKNLKKVKRRGDALDRILMIDDTPAKLRKSYGNLVRVQPWYGAADDDELRRLARYLNKICHAESFRQIEKRGWRLSL